MPLGIKRPHLCDYTQKESAIASVFARFLCLYDMDYAELRISYVRGYVISTDLRRIT
jgi:hypothetical protein